MERYAEFVFYNSYTTLCQKPTSSSVEHSVFKDLVKEMMDKKQAIHDLKESEAADEVKKGSFLSRLLG